MSRVRRIEMKANTKELGRTEMGGDVVAVPQLLEFDVIPDNDLAKICTQQTALTRARNNKTLGES